MSREFSKVAPAIWRSRRFRQLDGDARLCHLYLITCDHQSSAGCFRLPDAYAAADLAWDLARFEVARTQIVNAGLVAHDELTEEVFVHGWFRFSPPMNDKHSLGTDRLISNIESERLRDLVKEEFSAANNARRGQGVKSRGDGRPGYG